MTSTDDRKALADLGERLGELQARRERVAVDHIAAEQAWRDDLDAGGDGVDLAAAAREVAGRLGDLDRAIERLSEQREQAQARVDQADAVRRAQRATSDATEAARAYAAALASVPALATELATAVAEVGQRWLDARRRLAELHTDAAKAIGVANEARAATGEALIDAPPDAAAALDMPERSATFQALWPVASATDAATALADYAAAPERPTPAQEYERQRRQIEEQARARQVQMSARLVRERAEMERNAAAGVAYGRPPAAAVGGVFGSPGVDIA